MNPGLQSRCIQIASLVATLYAATLGRLAVADEITAVSPAITNRQSPEPKHWLDFVETGFQIAFWVVLGGITYSTYRQAKKTLLQPLRTEVFKVQLEATKEVVSMFMGEGEFQLAGSAGFGAILKANVEEMLGDFSETFFGVKVLPRAKKTKSNSLADFDCRYLLTPESVTSLLAKNSSVGDLPNSEEQWKAWGPVGIIIPVECNDLQEKLTRLTENPLLPLKLITLLKEYMVILDQNYSDIENVLIEAAKTLPKRITTSAKLTTFEYNYIHNMYNRHWRALKPKADEIIYFFRDHYGVDRLWVE